MGEKSPQQLICKRLQLRHEMGAILNDEARYQSFEFAECQQAITETNLELRKRNIDTTALIREFDALDRVLLESRLATYIPQIVARLAEVIPLPIPEVIEILETPGVAAAA